MPPVIIAALVAIVQGGSAAYALLYVALAAISYGAEQHRMRKAQRRMRDAMNANVQDRLVMLDQQPDRAATIVLGRVRFVEGILRRWQSGTHDEKLTLIVGFAGHEIDGFEKWYINETEVTLDANGWVLTPPWIKVTNVSNTQAVALNGSGAITYNTGNPIVAGSQGATYQLGDSHETLSCTISGNNLVVTGGPPSTTVWLTWQAVVSTPVIRIRPYLGAVGQNVGAAIAAEYPGKITATDRFDNIALAVVDLQYEPDVFPQGMPNFTALMRGAKVYDPRTGLTVFSENSSLHSYHYFRSALGWDCTSAEGREADISAAANECDISTQFSLRKADNTLQLVTLPRYRCGITINTEADPRAAMDGIMETMAGKWGWAGGTWRMRAGRSAAPVFALDESWIAQPLDDEGLPASDEPVVHITNGVPREQKLNSVSGRCVDPNQRYQYLPIPAVRDSALITAEGRTYHLDVDYEGVNHIAHAQHLAKIAIREGQAALRVQSACNLNAYRCELFDVGTVTLPVFGFDAKLFEVIGWRWHPTQGILLTKAETESAIYDTAELTGRDPAPNSTLTALTTVPTVTLNTPASGTAHLLRQPDGTLLTRVYVTWAAVVGERVRQGGQIEVRWGQAITPEAQWQSEFVDGSATEIYLLGIPDGAVIVVKARAINGLVRGNWSTQRIHTVLGKTALPANASGFTAAVEPGGVRFAWTRNEEIDVQGRSELHLEGVWNDATAPLFDGVANTWFWRGAPLGTHTVLLKHRDTTGNRSAAAVSVSVTVDAWVQQQVGNNLLNPSVWEVGTGGTQGVSPRRFVLSGSTSENNIVLGTAPDGTQQPLWFGESADSSAAGADGGWDTDPFGVDAERQYRFSVWFRPSGVMDGLYYLGPSSVRNVDGSTPSNPYFHDAQARSPLVPGRWYLLTGFVFPSGYTGGQQNIGGLYDGVTGQRLGSAVDFKWAAGQATTTQRVRLQNASVGAQQAYWGPRVDLCDGNEPTIGELLAVSMATRFDAMRTLSLLARGTCQALGNQASKPRGVNGWESDVYSRDSYTGGAFVSASAPVVAATHLMFGLNSDPTTDQNYTSLDYAVDLLQDGTYVIFESGVNSGVSGSWVANDVFAVAYDGNTTRYFKNGVVLRTVPAPIGLTLFFDSSLYEVGSQLNNIQFGPLTTRPRDGEVVNFRAVRGWDFARSLEGWAAVGATLTANADSLTVDSTGSDPQLTSPLLAVAGSLNDKVRVRMRRVAGSGWAGTLYYETAGHGVSESFKKTIPLGPGSAFEILEWDMASLTAGGTDWVSNVITEMRFDFGTTSADVFEVDWIAVGKTAMAGDLGSAANVTLIAGANGTVVGNSATKLANGGAWNWHVYSQEGYTRGAYAAASPAQANAALMFGLNNDPTTNESYTSIDYAMHCVADGTLRAYQSGVDQGQIGTYVAGDQLAVTYDGVNMRWVKNGAVLRTVALASAAAFWFDSSFFTLGATLRNIRFGPMSGVTDIGTLQLAGNAATEFGSASAAAVTCRLRRDTGATITPPFDSAASSASFDVLTLSYTNDTGETVSVECSASFQALLSHTSGSSGTSYGYLRARLSAVVGGTEYGEPSTLLEAISLDPVGATSITVDRSPVAPLITVAPGAVLSMAIKVNMRWQSGTPANVGDLIAAFAPLAMRFAVLKR